MITEREATHNINHADQKAKSRNGRSINSEELTLSILKNQGKKHPRQPTTENTPRTWQSSEALWLNTGSRQVYGNNFDNNGNIVQFTVKAICRLNRRRLLQLPPRRTIKIFSHGMTYACTTFGLVVFCPWGYSSAPE